MTKSRYIFMLIMWFVNGYASSDVRRIKVIYNSFYLGVMYAAASRSGVTLQENGKSQCHND